MSGEGPILVVDDDDDLRALLDMNLRRNGFETLTAANAAEAFHHLEHSRPALIVLDLLLPDVSGTEICRRVRATPRTAGSSPAAKLSASR